MKREDTYKDIAAMLDWLKTRPDLDSDRVMVTGGSYGGHMAFAISTYYPEKIRASLPVVGVSNFVTFLENTESYRRDLRRVEYGDERDPEMREFFERTAPLNNTRKITKPIFIVQGYNDPRVPRSRVGADCKEGQGEQHSRLVPDGARRGARLRQEEESGLPVLRDGVVHRGIPTQVDALIALICRPVRLSLRIRRGPGREFFKRVALDGDYVGVFPRLDCSDLSLHPQQFCAAHGGRPDGVKWLHAIGNHQVELARRGAVLISANVCAEGYLDAQAHGFREDFFVMRNYAATQFGVV